MYDLPLFSTSFCTTSLGKAYEFILGLIMIQLKLCIYSSVLHIDNVSVSLIFIILTQSLDNIFVRFSFLFS